jgi:hypothetical protein
MINFEDEPPLPHGSVPGWPDDFIDAHNAAVHAIRTVSQAARSVYDFEDMRSRLLLALDALDRRRSLAREYAPFPVPP